MKKSVLLVWLMAMPVLTNAQSYEPRESYGAYLEPTDTILHGAGQDHGAFVAYDAQMDAGEKPVVYMYYRHLRNIGTDWSRRLREDLLPYVERGVVIQFGLELVGVTNEVAAGQRDDDIADLIQGLEELGIPVYMRIGYEFNGLAWNGYLPHSYIAAFRYITDRIRASNAEVATLWNYVPDSSQPTGFMAYYPGDDYVDWWSINFFDVYQLTSPLADAFLDSARVHQKPVAIGESTPKDIGVTDGQADWDAWFAPFLARIASEPGIKMTGYINWDWSRFPQWSTWGDARLQSNSVVSGHFQDAMDNSIYAHASSTRGFRETLGATELIAPAQITGLQLDQSVDPATLRWDPSSDDSGISHYRIYADGDLVGFTGFPEFVLGNAAGSGTSLYTVTAVDRAGNQSIPADPFSITLQPGAEVIQNGGFEGGEAFWTLDLYAAGLDASWEIDESDAAGGSNSARISINQNSGTNWHIQLQQRFSVQQGQSYRVSFTAKADQPRAMEVWVQQDHDPWTAYGILPVELTTEYQTFEFSALADQDDDVSLRFMVGVAGTGTIWIDDVSVQNLSITSKTQGSEVPREFHVEPVFPNPMRASAIVPYATDTSQRVSISLYDALGRKVKAISNEIVPAGRHTAQIACAACASGMYWVHLSSPSGRQTVPLIIQK